MSVLLMRVMVCLTALAPLGGCCCPCSSSGEDLKGGDAEADGPDKGSGANKNVFANLPDPKAVNGEKFGEVTVSWDVPAGAEVTLNLTRKGNTKIQKSLDKVAGKKPVTFKLKDLDPGQFTAALSAKSMKEGGPKGFKFKRVTFTVEWFDSPEVKPIAPDKPTITTTCSISGIGPGGVNFLDYAFTKIPIDDEGFVRFSMTLPDYAKKLKISKPARRLSKKGKVVRVQAPLFDKLKDKTVEDFATLGLSNIVKVGTMKTSRGSLELQVRCFFETKFLGGKAIPLPFDQPKTKPYSLMYEIKREAKGARVTYEVVNGDQPLTSLDFIGTLASQSKELSGCTYKGSSGTRRVSRTQFNKVLTIYDRRTGKQVKKTVLRAATPKCSKEILSGRSSFSTFVSEDKIRETFKKMVAGLR